MDSNNSGDILLFLALTGVCIWLYIQLRKEGSKKAKLSEENAKLIAKNAIHKVDHLKFQL